MPAPDAGLLLASGAVLLGAFSQGLTGFGFALVSAPLLLFVLEPRELVVTVITLGTTACVLILSRSWRYVLPRRIAPLIAGSLFGLPVGAYVLTQVSPTGLKLAIAGVVVAFAIPLMLGHRRHFRREALGCLGAGFASGVLATSTSLGGPPIVLFLLNQGWGKENLRASLSGYFLVIGLLSLGSLAVAGVASAGVVARALYLLPALFGGIYMGSRLMPRVATDLYRRIAVSIVIATGLVGMATTLASLM